MRYPRVVSAGRWPGAAGWRALLALLGAALLQACTDTVTNPEQLIPETGLVYRGNTLVRDEVAAVDSASGRAVRILFAQLGAKGVGEGTYEAPFSTVAMAVSAAQAGDIVLVFRGTDPGVPDLRVPANVRLYSDHPFQEIPTRNFGRLTMPLTGTEPPTRVTGTFTLGAGCEIAGFQFLADDGYGIHGTEVAGVTIRNNRFLSTRRSGIHLLNVSGSIEIHHNQVMGTGQADSPGILLQNNRVTMSPRIRLNSVQDPYGDGIKIVTEGTGVTDAVVDSNTVLGSIGSGIKFFSFNTANTTALISNNVVSRNELDEAQDGAIRFGTFDDIHGKVTVVNNRVFDCGSNGIFIGSEIHAQTEVNILDNDVSECVGNGIFVGAQQTSFQRALISNNVSQRIRINSKTVGFPTGHGIFFGSLYSGRVEGTIVFNRLYENDKNGLFCASFNSGTVSTVISDNLISNNVSNGIELNSGLNIPPPGPDQVAPPLPEPGTNRSDHQVYNNVVAGNKGGGEIGQEGGGITTLVFNGAVMEAVFENNHVNNNGTANGAYGGLGVLVFNEATANLAVLYNTFSLNPASPAVNIRTFGAVPPALPVPGVSPALCLALVGNVSDTGFLLTRDDSTEFAAVLDGNTGPLLVPRSLDSDPGCTPPQLASRSER
ncbi:MAG: right-handed parallel beta-helix repeat-containing protein [Candidatus Latescibacterota bacterium]